MGLQKYIIVPFTFLILISGGIVYAQGSTNQSNQNTAQQVVLPSGQTINNDYFASGNTVEIDGTVNGDLYAAGGEVTVAGTVNGDVLAAGGNVRITGTVGQNVRAAGGNITISGKVGRNVTVAGGNVDIANSAQLGGSLVSGAGTVFIGAPIKGNATLGTGNFQLDNVINGDVNVATSQISLSPNAKINGNLIITSNNPISVNQNQVRGTITQNTTGVPSSRIGAQALRNIFAGLSLVAKIAWFITSLVIGLILIYLFPNFFTNVLDNLRTRTGYVFILGLLIFLLTPVLIFVLFATIIGIPLALMLLALYLILLYLAPLPVAYWIGSSISGRMGRTGMSWYLVIGLIVYTLILFIPLVSIFIKLVAVIFGIGMIFSIARKF